MVGFENFMKYSYTTGQGNLDDFNLEYAFLNEFESYIYFKTDINLNRINYQKRLRNLVKLVKLSLKSNL